MKFAKCAAAILCFAAAACGSKNKAAQTQTSVTPPPPSPPAINYDTLISEQYPPLAFDKVAPLKSLADFPIGMEVSAAQQERSIFIQTEQQAVLQWHFNSLVAGSIMKMSFLHPQENTYTFADADQLLGFAEQNNMLLHGHTLIWHWDSQIPDWMKNYTGDWDAMMHNHVFEIVSHYKGRVKSWDVVNEAIVDTSPTTAGYRETLFYNAMGKDYIENAFVSARLADSTAELYYNDWGIETYGAKLAFTLEMIEDFKKRAIPIDGLGFQMHIGLFTPALGDIRASFSAAAASGLKIKITELDVFVNQGTVPHTLLKANISIMQKDRYKDVIKAYLEHIPPAQRGGITVWGLVDGETWWSEYTGRPEWPLMFHDDFSVKPAYYGMVEALKEDKTATEQ